MKTVRAKNVKRQPCEISLESRLKTATQAQADGLSCPDAVFACYCAELGSNLTKARRLAGDYAGQTGVPQLCDVFAAALAILQHLDGGAGAEEKLHTIVARLGREYGSCRCEVPSSGEENPLCRMRVKDAVLLIEQARKRMNHKDENEG